MIRETLGRLISPLADPVAVATSGGIDSSSVVVAALDNGLKPTIISFTLADHESSDFKAARALAQHFDLPFLPTMLPTDPATILADVRRLIQVYGAQRKTAVEVCWPWLYMFPTLQAAGISNLLTGLTADGHFALTKRDAIHNRATTAAFQASRQQFFSDPNAAQKKRLARIGQDYGVTLHVPYADPTVFALWENASWDDVNRPQQKQAVRQEFPELAALRIQKHSDMQLGDSGIAALVGETARQHYAPEMKSPVAAYNRIARLP